MWCLNEGKNGTKEVHMLIEFVKENWLFVALFIVYTLIWVITDHKYNKKPDIYTEEEYKNFLQYQYDRENHLNSEN
jgi:hypothetical protein